MKKVIHIMAFLIGIGMLQAQENGTLFENGDVLTLNTPSGAKYKHIDFPRKNMIIKRGGIADFKSLIGTRLVVHEVIRPDGSSQILLKRKDGMNFFRFFPSVEANVERAILSGELKKSGQPKENAIAQK